MTRYEGRAARPQQMTNANAQFEIEPGGDLFPMYKRYRFVFDQYISQNGNVDAGAFGRATGVGEEPLQRPPAAVPELQPRHDAVLEFRAGAANCNRSTGAWVYCFDLAEKKERWQKNLLGDPVPNQAQPALIQEAGAEGEVVVRTTDNFMLTLGKSTVLQPGYCALLTRDGIEVVEPLSRRVLWTRRGLPERAHIHGDGRYIVLVESGSDKKPVKATLLRATDGMPVEGSPDSGRVLASARSFIITGRFALLTEGTGDEPRVLRLYDLATGKDVWSASTTRRPFPSRDHRRLDRVHQVQRRGGSRGRKTGTSPRSSRSTRRTWRRTSSRAWSADHRGRGPVLPVPRPRSVGAVHQRHARVPCTTTRSAPMR